MSSTQTMGRRAVSTAALLLFASGCISRAQLHTTLDAPTTSVRLTRADTAPLTAAFRQEDHAIIGQVGFAQGCSEETRQVVHREMRRSRIDAGWVVATTASAGLAVLGAYFMSSSSSANHEVVCGNGAGAPKAGDKCQSEASILEEAGASLLTSGLLLTGTSGVMLARSRYTERNALPDQQTLQVRQARPCGNLAALDGMTVAVLLPRFGGKWAGRVAADGTARIELGRNLTLPHGALLDVFVESVPSALAGMVSPGNVVARVTLESTHEAQQQHHHAPAE